MKVGIDVRTNSAKALIRRLKPLKTTESVEDGGMYREDNSYSQVILSTSMTEKQLDDWIYALKNIDVIGTFTLESLCHE